MTTNKSTSLECATPEWADLREFAVADGTAPILFRDAQIAQGGGALYIIGNNVPSLLRPVTATGVLSIWALGKGMIEAPSGAFTFVKPQAVVDKRRRLHLLWGEPRGHDLRDQAILWANINVHEIWSASYDEALGWSEPKQLLSDSSVILWTASIADQVSVDGYGNAALAVPVVSPDPPQSVLLLFDGEAWSTVEPPVQGTTSTLIRGDKIVVAYLAAAEGSARDANSVFVIRSGDRGRSWSSPELVWRSGVHPATALRLRATPDDALHLIWAQQQSDGTPVLRHVIGQRDTTGWTHTDDLALNGGFNALQAIVGACGNLFVVFENYPNMGPEGSLTIAAWRERWSKATDVFATWRPMNPAIGSMPNGKIVLTMLVRQGPDPLNPSYRQLWTQER